MEEIYSQGGRLAFALTLTDTQAPNKSGRIYLDDFCSRHSIALFKSRNMNDPEAVEFVRSQSVDWLFVIGWSHIARPPLLSTLRRGALGIHPTLLPVGRGRSAIPWTIIRGLPEAGATLFKLDDGVDTGPVIAKERIPLGARETATELYAKLITAHRNLIRHAWPDIAADRVREIPQDDSKATVWPARTPDDGRLEPLMTVSEADRLVRATTHPYPGAFLDQGSKRLRIWSGSIAGSAPPGERAIRVEFADGQYDVEDWEAEAMSNQG